MKVRILIVALLVGGCLSSTAADRKKKKDKKKAKTELTVETRRDSLSYAAGMSMTQGLQQYLKQQYGVDSAYYADFVEGYREAVASKGDKRFQARAAGAAIAQMVEQRMLPQAEDVFKDTPDSLREELFHKGFTDGVVGDASVLSQGEASEYFNSRARSMAEQKTKAWQKENTDWLAQNATKPGVKTTASGLQYKVLTQGSGAVPTEKQEVVVKYEGKLIDGTIFDSSYERTPQTSTFRCNQVIKGWTEALTMMPAGSKWELYIPEKLAYGGRAMGGKIKPYSTLIFTVELVSIKEEAKKNTTETKK